MALTKLTQNLSYHQGLSDKPNLNDGLTPTQVKQRYDQAANDIKTYVNDTLTPEIEDQFATKSEVQGITLGQIPDNSITTAKIQDKTTQIAYGGTTTNIGNDYSLAIPILSSLSEGLAVSFKCNADSTGAVTLNWSGTGAKNIIKSNGVAMSTLKNGIVYTVRYNGTNFILQGEGGEYGTATAPNVLAPYTIGTDTGVVVGTMVDHNSNNIQCTFTSDVTISAGYYNGSGKVLRPGFSPGIAATLFRDNTNTYQTTSSTYVKMLEKTLFIGGALRIQFVLKSGTNLQLAYARIYRNGIAVGTERNVNSTNVVSFTEDISGWLPGDKFQLYMRGSGSNYSIIDVANGGIGITINEVFIT